MPPAPKDPLTQLLEAFAPAINALTELFKMQAAIPSLINRIAEAQKTGEILNLSADDVKVLCVILSNLSDKKK